MLMMVVMMMKNMNMLMITMIHNDVALVSSSISDKHGMNMNIFGKI